MADRLDTTTTDRIVALASLVISGMALVALYFIGSPGYVGRQIWWILLITFVAGCVTGWINGAPAAAKRNRDDQLAVRGDRPAPSSGDD